MRTFRLYDVLFGGGEEEEEGEDDDRKEQSDTEDLNSHWETKKNPKQSKKNNWQFQKKPK